jgi:hypothetical protein
MNRSLGKISPWKPWKLLILKLLLPNSSFLWLLTWSHPMHGLTVMSFQRQVTVLKGSGQTEHKSQFPVLGLRWVKLGAVWLQILQLTCSAFQCLLIHMISITKSMVTAVQRQHSCGVLVDHRKSDSSTGLKLGNGFRISEDFNFYKNCHFAYSIR